MILSPNVIHAIRARSSHREPARRPGDASVPVDAELARAKAQDVGHGAGYVVHSKLEVARSDSGVLGATGDWKLCKVKEGLVPKAFRLLGCFHTGNDIYVMLGSGLGHREKSSLVVSLSGIMD